MKVISNFFIKSSATIREAIEIIDKAGGQIALVTELDRLLGIVTDGDIRRAVLRDISLEAPVEHIMRRDFHFLPSTATVDEALAMMQKETLHQIPSLDEAGKVVELFLLQDLVKPQKHSNTVIIMAGGVGERLRPLTFDCPKPMLRVGGKPMLEIILEQCLEAGFNDFYFAVNYLKDQIQSYFNDGRAWKTHIQYLEEDRYMGTAGAISLLPRRPTHPFLVLNGDVLTKVNYRRLLQFHEENNSSATLSVRENITQIPYGVVKADGIKFLTIEEKPSLKHYINAGIYLLNPEIFDLIPTGKFLDMPQLLKAAADSGKLVATFPIHEYWLDVGRPETLEQAMGEWQ